MRFALAACSDPITRWGDSKLPAFRQILGDGGHELDTRASQLVVRDGRVDPRERAELLNSLFVDPTIDAILDVSGGDLANEVLDYLDYAVIASSPKPYVGYSDNSTTILALRELAGIRSTWWHPDRILTRGLGELEAIVAGKIFRPHLEPDHPDDARTTPGDVLIGGNIRCVAKLAGTRYWPTIPAGASVLLEGRSNTLASVATYLTQLRHVGFFDNVSSLVLGQLTEIDSAGSRPVATRLAREITGLPIWHAPGVGHSPNCEPWTVG